jgi:hypothetical protein
MQKLILKIKPKHENHLNSNELLGCAEEISSDLNALKKNISIMCIEER